MTAALAALLAVLDSLAALVLPLTPRLVCGVSAPPAVPGRVSVTSQVMVPEASSAVSVLPADAVQLLTLTVAPAGVPATAVQVGELATPGPALLHTKAPVLVKLAPGLAWLGKPAKDTLMSDAIEKKDRLAIRSRPPAVWLVLLGFWLSSVGSTPEESSANKA